MEIYGQVNVPQQINGLLNGNQQIIAKIGEQHQIILTINKTSTYVNGDLLKHKQLYGTINTSSVIAPTYVGNYEVNPYFTTQMLYTKDKQMLDNVTVNPIEVQRVSNPQGGKTIYIGGAING